jgi:glycosyl transferase family 2
VRGFLAPPPARPERSGATTPTFSILVPVYNSAATIAETLESAFAQTVPPHDVVVCDDGSTDRLDDAIAPYRDRIAFIRKENGGGASALNAAAARARGEFVALLDADDVYAPERVEALTELAAARPDLDIVTTDAFYELDGHAAGRFNGPANPFEAVNQREAILERCFILAPAVRRTRLLEAGGWDPSLAIGYDWDCWLRLILDGSVAGSVDEPLLGYRLHDESLSAKRIESFRERIAILERAGSQAVLTDSERRTLDASLGAHRRTLLLAEAHESMRDASPDARARLLAVTREPGFGRRTRLKAYLLAHAPASARVRLLEIAGFGGRSERRQVTADGAR